MKGIVDRFEGQYVVIEIDGKTEDIPKEFVDETVEVSDVVKLSNGIWRKAEEETDKRSEHIKALMDSVWED